jgi:hypothetical protein
LLAAHAKGLSAAWKTGKMVHSAGAKKFLGIDVSDRIIAIVYLGVAPAEDSPVRERGVASAITWVEETGVPA